MRRTWKSFALIGGMVAGGLLAVGCGDDKAPLPVKHTEKDGGTSRPRPGDEPSKGKKSLPRLDE